MRYLPWHQRLSTQLTFPMLVAVFAIFAGLTYFLLSAQQENALRSAYLDLASSLSVEQGSFNRMLSADRISAVPELLSEIHVHPRVDNAVIVDSEGNYVWRYEPNVINGKLERFYRDLDKEQFTRVTASGETLIEYHPEHDHFVAIAPILRGRSVTQEISRNLLIVEYRHSYGWYNIESLPLWPLGLFVALLGIVGISLWLALQKFAARPAEQLVVAVRQYGAGQPISGKLPYNMPNEFGFLARQLRLAVRDRSEREQKLAKLSTAVEQANDSIVITDLSGAIEYVNPAFERISGYTKEEVIGRNPRILSSGRTPAETYQEMWDSLVAGRTWQGELYNLTKDGEEFREWATISPLRNEQGVITHYLGSKLNITERVEAEARIEHLAYFDTLTDLPNRISCVSFLTESLKQHQPGHNAAAVLFDLDGLQRINDVRGFRFGDEILCEIAKRFRGLLHDEPRAFLANLGGDLFAVMLPARDLNADALLQDVQTFVKLVLSEVAQPISVQGERVSVTASAGIVIYNNKAESADAVIRHAETAVHTAKAAGGNQTAVYDTSYSQQLERRYDIERGLRHAIETDGLALYLQPQVNAQGQAIGAEVLVRWQHPERGMISPAEFIPTAEQTDLIVDLGKWILREALQLLKQLPAPLTLAINISPRQFRKFDFVYCIEQELQASGADPQRLILEITENLFVEDMTDIIEKMRALRETGVQFSIDDFGTGYSSLSYLQKLPIQELKIDRSFVNEIAVSEQQAIIDSVIAIAQNLKLRIVAEGVETEAQAQYLASHEKNIVLQGYLFGKPEPAANFFAKQHAASDSKNTD